MELTKLNYKLNLKLHPNQQAIHSDAARFKAIMAGKRFGKSIWAGFELVQMAFKNPGLYWYIAPTYGQAKEIMWDFLKSIIPQQLIIGHPLNTDLEINLNLYDRGYSKIKLKGTDNETSLRGPALDGGIMDEAAYDETKGYAWPNILRGQLARSKGPFYFISSPHKNGKNWYSKLCDAFRGREAAGDADFMYRHFTIYDNPLLDKKELEDIKNGCTDDKWRLEYMAEESEYGGLLVSEFNHAVHVREDVDMKDMIFIRGIDWGMDHPTTCLWIGVNPLSGNVHVFDEYYRTGKLIYESAGMIKEMTGSRHIEWTIIDPSTGRKDHHTGRTDKDEFQRCGIFCIPGDNRDRGLDVMKMFFKTDKITIHPKCKNLIAELNNYCRGDGVGDDCLDPLRYALLRIHDMMFNGNVFPKEEENILNSHELKLDGLMEIGGTKAADMSMSWAYAEDVV